MSIESAISGAAFAFTVSAIGAVMYAIGAVMYAIGAVMYAIGWALLHLVATVIDVKNEALVYQFDQLLSTAGLLSAQQAGPTRRAADGPHAMWLGCLVVAVRTTTSTERSRAVAFTLFVFGGRRAAARVRGLFAGDPQDVQTVYIEFPSAWNGQRHVSRVAAPLCGRPWQRNAVAQLLRAYREVGARRAVTMLVSGAPGPVRARWASSSPARCAPGPGRSIPSWSRGPTSSCGAARSTSRSRMRSPTRRSSWWSTNSTKWSPTPSAPPGPRIRASRCPDESKLLNVLDRRARMRYVVVIATTNCTTLRSADKTAKFVRPGRFDLHCSAAPN